MKFNNQRPTVFQRLDDLEEKFQTLDEENPKNLARLERIFFLTTFVSRHYNYVIELFDDIAWIVFKLILKSIIAYQLTNLILYKLFF